MVFILLITLQNLVSLRVVVVFIYLIYNCFGNNVLHKITLKVKKTKQVAMHCNCYNGKVEIFDLNPVFNCFPLGINISSDFF